MAILTRTLPALVLSCLLAACGGGGEGGTGGLNLTSPVPASVTASNYAVVAWNDLGMHCIDGKDYSVFSILPPYNNLHAQVIQRNVTTNKLVTAGITVSYESVADASGSINTSSYLRTTFWTWVQQLFGVTLANDVGLTNNPTPSATPRPLTYNGGNGWWEATGIPITPYDDAGNKNYYPMVKVVVRDSTSNAILASTKVVLPVSDEMSCKTCHASTSGNAARPTAGWVNDADIEKDWKRNILRLHDENHPGAIATAGKAAKYGGSTLSASVAAGQPVLCGDCHKTNALGTALVAGIKPLTEAMHSRHANVANPNTSASLETDATRTACYLCHPGSVTKCLRGVMGNAVVAGTTTPSIDCQSCHGPMSSVGATGREGWLDEPACQNCHDRAASGTATFSRYLSVFSSGTTVRSNVDPLFATNANKPAAGKSLYRFSTGHGGLQCEACHGATHAEYPSSHSNDNVQSSDLQGHTGTLRECATCHASVPNTPNGGPHGMHTIGAAWVGQHTAYGWRASCVPCHGSDARGTFLSKTASGVVVGCYTCHNGPGGG